MNLRFTVILLLIICNENALSAQNYEALKLQFNPLFGKVALVLNQSYFSANNNDSIQFDVLRFYISGIELLLNGKTVWKELNSFHLLDASVISSLSINLNTSSKPVFDKLKFNLGIDSITNVAGAMGGDLDPTKGMYWTWQSGYINFKLEGKSKVCNTRNNEFTFHLGGYQYPYNTLQTVNLNTNNLNELSIILNVEEMISIIDLSKQNHIMSPGKEAVLLSNELTRIFSVQ